MTTQQNYCKYYHREGYSASEVGGGAFPIVIPNAIPKCKINLNPIPTSNMDWQNCNNTPFAGPCWQHKELTVEEWEKYVENL